MYFCRQTHKNRKHEQQSRHLLSPFRFRKEHNCKPYIKASSRDGVLSISHFQGSTRQEKNGVEYHFFTVDEFRKMIAEDKFVEFEEVYAGSYYGTLKSEVQRIWDKGHVIIFDVDVKGGVNLKKYFGEKALSVFIQAPSVEELRKRLIARGTDSAEAIEKRVAKAAEEMTYADKFDSIIVNDDLQTAYNEADTLVDSFLKD